MFDHGTRPAAMPRSTIDATWMTQASIGERERDPLVAAGAAVATSATTGRAFSATSVAPAYARRSRGRRPATACDTAARLLRSSTNAMNASAYTAIAE